jgi:flagellar biosynthesis/type III secretory pathway protein FliH
MSLIKATDLQARRVRIPDIRVPVVLPTAAHPPTPVIDQERLALEGQVEALSEELQDLAKALQAREARIGELECDLDAGLADAEAKGREAGLAQGAEAKAEALAILEGSAERALGDFRAELQALEILAVALAKAGLAKVFGDGGEMTDKVARLIRRQLQELERTAVLRMEVSAADFGSGEALDGLRLAAGLDDVELKANDALSAGDCRIRLRLGELDIGLGQQWGRLSGMLDDALAVEAAE